MGVPEKDPLAQLALPPGFRFYPTDEELLVQYLCPKAAGHNFSVQVIGDIDLYKFDPWMLPSKAMFGEKEWYFFSPRDRKYPNGSRPNRVAGSGYWKATGTDKVITTKGRKVGIKKALVFYVGKAPKGSKTNWIMHEYRLSDGTLRRKSVSSKLDDWVLCRIYEKNASVKPAEPIFPTQQTSGGGGGGGDDDGGNPTSPPTLFESLPGNHNRSAPLPRMNSLKRFTHQHQPLYQHQQQQQPPQQHPQEEEFGIINRCGSASSRIEYWSTLLGMTLPSGPNLSSIGLGPCPAAENWGPTTTTNGVNDDVCPPVSNTLPPLCHVGSPPRQDRFGGGSQGWLFDGVLDDSCSPSFLYSSGGRGWAKGLNPGMNI